MRHTCFGLDKENPALVLHNNVNKRERNTPLLNNVDIFIFATRSYNKSGLWL